MSVLPQLNATNYSCNTFIYKPRALLEAENGDIYPSLEDWVEIFYNSIPSFVRTAEADESVDDSKSKAAVFATRYKEMLDSMMFGLKKDGFGAWKDKFTCLELCNLREIALKEAGFHDIYKSIKQEENEKALKLLPAVLAELDAEESGHRRWELIWRGVCAANIFDLGAAHTTEMYHKNGGVSFHDTREQLLPRPWVIDDLNALVDRLANGPHYKKALVFVDNAGADFVLGMIPLARELIRHGTNQVVIASNEKPAINDMTEPEIRELLPRIASTDLIIKESIESGKIRVVSSGNGLPVIDLTRVAPRLVDAAKDADLVILEGMGRSIETNLNATFCCDSVRVGMVKHPEVAASLGGRMLDCVIKFEMA